ncbi:hypothetical protein [Aliivibrio fischeri]|uniref:hypothetical protein n=1 Tax=Aliivibrio fischeri TaxID=668 RepID=UPI003736BBB9
MKLTKTIIMCAILGLSFQATASDYIRLESGVNRDIYKLETQVKLTDSTAGIFSVEGNKETSGLEYNLATAYGKYRMPLSEKMSAEFDFGLAYESMGDDYAVIAKKLGISDDFKTEAGAIWGGATLNYFLLPNFLTTFDLMATHDVINESIIGMYRARAKFVYQPIENLNLVYRAGLNYAQNDITRDVVKAGHVVSDYYVVSHEFYIGYMGASGLEPYLMLKDMENEASYDVILGFYYRFN